MLVIGLVGGVASGKTQVAEEFRRLGAALVDGDKIGHGVLREEACKRALRARFGPTLFTEAGEVNRAAVAKIVFGPTADAKEALSWLESLTHPRIRARIWQELFRATVAGSAPAVVLDAPVLLQAGWRQYCDELVFVHASLAVRQARARSRGWPPGELERREAHQTPLTEKQSQATVEIDNSGEPEPTSFQVAALWQRWAL